MAVPDARNGAKNFGNAVAAITVNMEIMGNAEVPMGNKNRVIHRPLATNEQDTDMATIKLDKLIMDEGDEVVASDDDTVSLMDSGSTTTMFATAVSLVVVVNGLLVVVAVVGS